MLTKFKIKQIKDPPRYSTSSNKSNLRGLCPQIEQLTAFLLKSDPPEKKDFDYERFEAINFFSLQEHLDKGEKFPDDTGFSLKKLNFKFI